jgi:hypothetical protein
MCRFGVLTTKNIQIMICIDDYNFNIRSILERKQSGVKQTFMISLPDGKTETINIIQNHNKGSISALGWQLNHHAKFSEAENLPSIYVPPFLSEAKYHTLIQTKL